MPQGRLIPEALKREVLRLSSNSGITSQRILELTGVSKGTQSRIRSLFRKAGGKLKMSQGSSHKVLNGLDIRLLEACIERAPEITLRRLNTKLKDVRGLCVDLKTVWNYLHRRGLALKPVVRPSLERYQTHRREYETTIKTSCRPEQLVFIDESHSNRFALRTPNGRHFNSEWLPIASGLGQRARRRDIFIQERKFAIIPAISLSGIVSVDVSTSPTTHETFKTFVQHVLGCMNPFPGPNSVLVMDHAPIHHSDELEAIIESRGMRVEYIPSFSPDLNPVEHALTCIKAHILSDPNFILGEKDLKHKVDPVAIIRAAVANITSQKTAEWFRSCGYLDGNKAFWEPEIRVHNSETGLYLVQLRKKP